MSIFPSSPFPSPEQREMERRQKAERWQELAERYGTVHTMHNPYLGVEDETSFLQQLEQLDRVTDDPTYMTVHARLGYPIVKPLPEIRPADLEAELDSLLEFMYLNGIAIDFLCDVTDTEAYRFIVEELFDEESTDMRGTGMTSHFIYEEFHPNAEYDAKFWAEEFVSSLLHHRRESVELTLGRYELYDRHGAPTTREALLQRIDTFFRRHPTIKDVKIEALTCQMDGDYAIVELATTWTRVQASPSDLIQIIGRSQLRMKRNDNDYWEVVQAKIAGWE